MMHATRMLDKTLANSQPHCLEGLIGDDSRNWSSDSSNGFDSSGSLLTSTCESPNTLPLTPVLKTVVEKRKRATRAQMEKDWRDSRLYMNDLLIVKSMKECGIYKNVREQYNWYLDQVFKKHSEQFSAHIARINVRKPTKKRVFTTLPRVCTTPQHVVRFQEENQHKLTGRRGGVYTGFSKDNVKEQFGLSLESLLLFTKCSDCYGRNMTFYTAESSTGLIAQLKTRLLSKDNLHHLAKAGFSSTSVLSEAVEVISKLTSISDTLKGSTSNTTEWEKSEEYHLHSEMVAKSKQLSLFECIDVYFQWYMTLISEKHKAKFTQRITEINKESSKVPNSYTITVVDNNVALGLLGFQVHYKDALENGEVCMGFAKHEVADQYGITAESLFTFNECAEWYLKSGITMYGARSECIVSELITRMKNTEYRMYQGKFNNNMVQIIYKTLEVVSEITTLPSKFDVKLHLQMLREVEEDEHKMDEKQEKTMNHDPNLGDISKKLKLQSIKTEEAWEQSEEYRFDSEMIDKSKQLSIFECINVYFQWYMDLVSEKHADKFNQRITEINKESSKVSDGYSITVVENNVALGLLGFQVHYKDALENGEVCMGFAKHEVADQYGITAESLFTFNECAEWYLKSGITMYGARSECIVSELITRMKSAEYRTYLCDFDKNMMQILYKTFEVVSNLTAPNSNLYVKLQEALRIFGGKASKATRVQMEKDWRDSRLYMNDLLIVKSMKECGIYKNVREQYNWYLDQVFKKHSEQFSAHIARINVRKPTKKRVFTTLPRVCTTPQHVVRFQEENQHKLTGRRGGVYTGFSQDNVKEQFGLSLESLLLFTKCSDCYGRNMTFYTAESSTGLIAQLKTRLLSKDNLHHLAKAGFSSVSVLSEAVEVISKLTSISDTP